MFWTAASYQNNHPLLYIKISCYISWLAVKRKMFIF